MPLELTEVSMMEQYLLPWARVGTADKRTEDLETARLVKEHLDKEIQPWL
jgi:hypothetical protein